MPFIGSHCPTKSIDPQRSIRSQRRKKLRQEHCAPTTRTCAGEAQLRSIRNVASALFRQVTASAVRHAMRSIHGISRS